MLAAHALDVMVYCDDVEACRMCWTEKLGFRQEGVRPGPAGSEAPVLSFGPFFCPHRPYGPCPRREILSRSEHCHAAASLPCG